MRLSLRQLLLSLMALVDAIKESGKAPDSVVIPDDVNVTGRVVSRVELKLIRAQYNRELFPEQYTPDNPQGLYRGELRRFLGPDGEALNRESNVWVDFTAYDQNGDEFRRDAVVESGLAYNTALFVNDGHIIGGGADPSGEPKDWRKTNPTGANISEAAWDQSKGFTTRVHLSDSRRWHFEGSVGGVLANALEVRTS